MLPRWVLKTSARVKGPRKEALAQVGVWEVLPEEMGTAGPPRDWPAAQKTASVRLPKVVAAPEGAAVSPVKTASSLEKGSGCVPLVILQAVSVPAAAPAGKGGPHSDVQVPERALRGERPWQPWAATPGMTGARRAPLPTGPARVCLCG